MKIRKIMAMMIAAVAVCVGFVSCGDDDEETIAVAQTLAGSYSGELSTTVMGSESKDNATYEIKKIDDTHVSMTTPAAGSGMMALPSITLDNIPVTTSNKNGSEVVSASIDKVSGSITVNGAEKSYTFSDVVIVNSGNKVSIAYSLQYGKMPVAMICSFVGNK